MANAITIIRLLLVPVFLYYLLTSGRNHEAIAFFVFLIAGLTDLCDGYIARLTGHETKLGSLVDPIADWALILAALFGMAYIALIPLWALILLLIRDGILVTGFLGIKAIKKPLIAVNLFGKTTSGLLMVAMGAVLFQAAFLYTSVWTWVFYVTVVLYVSSGLVYVAQQGSMILRGDTEA